MKIEESVTKKENDHQCECTGEGGGEEENEREGGMKKDRERGRGRKGGGVSEMRERENLVRHTGKLEKHSNSTKLLREIKERRQAILATLLQGKDKTSSEAWKDFETSYAKDLEVIMPVINMHMAY